MGRKHTQINAVLSSTSLRDMRKHSHKRSISPKTDYFHLCLNPARTKTCTNPPTNHHPTISTLWEGNIHKSILFWALHHVETWERENTLTNALFHKKRIIFTYVSIQHALKPAQTRQQIITELFQCYGKETYTNRCCFGLCITSRHEKTPQTLYFTKNGLFSLMSQSSTY